jgi:hypothetical protein
MKIGFVSSFYIIISEFTANWLLLVIIKSTRESTYCEHKGKIFRFLKYSVQKSLILAPIMTLVFLPWLVIAYAIIDIWHVSYPEP